MVMGFVGATVNRAVNRASNEAVLATVTECTT